MSRRSLTGCFVATLFCVAVCSLPSAVLAHHILGIPHYAYDEQYPQTPILTYVVDAGRYEVRMTGYPGIPEPGSRCDLHVYIRDLETGALFDSTVTMTVTLDQLMGADPVVYGPLTARLEQNVYKFFPQFPDEANYVIRIHYEAEGAPWDIDLPMVVGEPGSPWLVVGGFGLGLGAFLIVVRAIRIKQRRRQRRAATAKGYTAPGSAVGA